MQIIEDLGPFYRSLISLANVLNQDQIELDKELMDEFRENSNVFLSN
jgi:hypothetical protein